MTSVPFSKYERCPLHTVPRTGERSESRMCPRPPGSRWIIIGHPFTMPMANTGISPKFQNHR